MKKSNASMSEWPAIAVAAVLAVPVGAAFINWTEGDQRALTPQETYERDYEFCMHNTGYELE